MKMDMRAAVALSALLFRPALAGDAVAGKAAFGNQCAVCHTVAVGKNGFGPSLAQVIGRHSGSLKDYNYSSAMSNAGLIWQADTLDVFLTSSTDKVPG
jgi:cytochrome c2